MKIVHVLIAWCLTSLTMIMKLNFKSKNRDLLLFQEPIKEYQLQQLTHSPFEDAFDEIDLLSIPFSCLSFDLLQTKYSGDMIVLMIFNINNS